MMTTSTRLRVLVACEYSGVVRRAFRALGHDAWSCDLLAAEDGGPHHFIGDVRQLFNRGWDLMLAFPPCTYLCSSGMHWTTRGLRDPQLTEDALAFVRALLDAPIPHIALENPVGAISTRIRRPNQIIQPWMFGENASKKTCLWLKDLPCLTFNMDEVVPPKGWVTVRGADDMVECEDCGEPFCPVHGAHYAECECIGPTQDEATYRTIDGVLFATLLDPAPRPVWGNQTPSGQNKLGPSDTRWMDRSRTYEGIAAAFAEQYSHYILGVRGGAKGRKGPKAERGQRVEMPWE